MIGREDKLTASLFGEPELPRPAAMIWTDPVITSTDAIVQLHREQVCALLRELGHDPNVCFRMEYRVIDVPLVRVFTYRQRDGKYYLRCIDEHGHADHTEACTVASASCDSLLSRPLPHWWAPTSHLGLLDDELRR